MQFDHRIVDHLQAAGFYGIARIGSMLLDWHLITAFIERWRPETHTFHMPIGEVTITLQDVGILFGLPIDGSPVTGVAKVNVAEICEELLGFVPTEEEVRGARLSLFSLGERFNALPEGIIDAITIERYARAYILQIIGGILFSDKTGGVVHLMYLEFLRDLQTAGTYSWGAACLSWLYRELCRATDIKTNTVSGALLLVQLWAWDRFPCIAPTRTLHLRDDHVGQDTHLLPAPPLAYRWRHAKVTTAVSTHVLLQIRFTLDSLKPDQVIWEPYNEDVIAALPDYCTNGQGIWQTVSPLICFSIVEWHRPNRVMKQFGMRQQIPEACSADTELHQIDLRGKHDVDWRTRHRLYIENWNNRASHLANGETCRTPMDYYDPYMQWYRTITRRFLTKQAALNEYMLSGIEQIHHLTLEDNLSMIPHVRTVAADLLMKMNEGHRVRTTPSPGQSSHHAFESMTQFTPTTPFQQRLFNTDETPTFHSFDISCGVERVDGPLMQIEALETSINEPVMDVDDIVAPAMDVDEPLEEPVMRVDEPIRGRARGRRRRGGGTSRGDECEGPSQQPLQPPLGVGRPRRQIKRPSCGTH